MGFFRDLALGAAPDGAEPWANPGTYARGASIGAPPDAFSPSGQIWNLPPPNPEAMAASACAGFRDVLVANMRHAGALRIDHAMGLSRLFWIPEGATAAEGPYVRYPLDALLGVLAIESVRARCLVVGEDLGTVPDLRQPPGHPFGNLGGRGDGIPRKKTDARGDGGFYTRFIAL